MLSSDIIFTARCLGLLGGQSSMVIRSLLSKLVSKSDLGKVYSMLGCLENIIPLIFSPILTFTYNHTLNTFPGAVYAVSASITGIAVILFLYICLLIETHQVGHSLVNNSYFNFSQADIHQLENSEEEL